MTSLAGASPSGTSEPLAAEIGTRRDGDRRRCTTLSRMRPAPPVRQRPPRPDDGILQLRIPRVPRDTIFVARDRHHIAANLRGLVTLRGMTMPAARLSKSRFVTGVQCHKLLWWTVHEPDAVELQPDKVLQDLFDQVRQVGEIARTRFPGGVLIDAPHNARVERVAA